MTALDCPTCITFESWEAFVEIRRRKGSRAPLTEYAAKLVIKKLIDADRQGYDAQHMIDEAIENGWTTVWVTQRPPNVNNSAQETVMFLDSQKQTAEQRAAAEEARKRVMSGIRKVS